MTDYQPESTGEILRRLRLERRFNALPAIVLAAFRKLKLIQLGLETQELTPQETALVQKHHEFLSYVDEEIERWSTIEINGTKIEGKQLLRIIRAANQSGDRVGVGPYFMDMAEPPSEGELEIQRYIREQEQRSSPGTQNSTEGDLGKFPEKTERPT